MTYARSFIYPPACFLKGRLVYQANCLLQGRPSTDTHYIIVATPCPVLSNQQFFTLIVLCLDCHRSSICRAHGWTANHQLYQQFGISEFLIFSPAFHRALAFCCYFPLRTIFLQDVIIPKPKCRHPKFHDKPRQEEGEDGGILKPQQGILSQRD